MTSRSLKAKSAYYSGAKSLIIGFLFLINPDYFTFDVLPDVFGYLLIAHGLYCLSFLEDRLFRARRLARFLALSSLIKLFSNFVALSTNIESDRLTVMFIFACVDGTMGLLFASNLFKGIQYLAVRQNSDLSLKGIDVAGVFLQVFFVAKSVLSFLPASMILFYSTVDSDPELVEGYASIRRDFVSSRLIVTVICFIAIIAFGVYTAVVMSAYMKRVRSDTAFLDRIKVLYQEKVTDNRDALVRIHVRESFGYFLAAMLFIPDLYIDHVGLLPGFVAGILVFMGLRNLSIGIVIPRNYSINCLIFSFLSFAAYLFRFLCLVLWEDKFQDRFWGSALSFLFGMISGVSALVFLYAVLTMVIRVCRRETEVRWRLYFVFVTTFMLAVAGCGVFGYIYPGRSGVIQAVQIGLALISLYLFWRKTDQIMEEVDYRRM